MYNRLVVFAQASPETNTITTIATAGIAPRLVFSSITAVRVTASTAASAKHATEISFFGAVCGRRHEEEYSIEMSAGGMRAPSLTERLQFSDRLWNVFIT